jgi:integrase
VKKNPACCFVKNRITRDAPLNAIKKGELLSFYQSLRPNSPCSKRDRCMLGLVLFQALTRSELAELVVSDIDFDNGKLSVPGTRRTNERQLNLEPYQVQHLHEYIHVLRKDFVQFRGRDNGRLFLAYGSSDSMSNAINILLKKLRLQFPQIHDLRHIRASVITHWQTEKGTIEAMYQSDHRYASSTKRYDLTPLKELQDQLQRFHPVESLNI